MSEDLSENKHPIFVDNLEIESNSSCMPNIDERVVE